LCAYNNTAKLATTGDNNMFHGQSAHRQYFSMGFDKLTMGCGLVHFDPGTKQNGFLEGLIIVFIPLILFSEISLLMRQKKQQPVFKLISLKNNRVDS